MGGDEAGLREKHPQNPEKVYLSLRFALMGVVMSSADDVIGGDVSDIIGKPYVKRQLVIFSADEVVDAARQAAASQQSSSSSEVIDMVKIAGAVAGGLLSKSTAGLVVTLGIAAVQAFEAWSKARSNGLPVLPITARQAEGLVFPPGHPRYGVVYVAHPANERAYVPLADFHRFTFEHKFSEAIELLMSLGATSMCVEHVTGWSRDFCASISAPITVSSLGKAEISAEVGARRRKDVNVLFEATLDGCVNPIVPDDIYWYEHEPTWRAIVHGRVKYGLRDFSLNVSYLDDFGINAGLKAKIEKSGLEIGGKFEGHEATIWRISGTFGRAEVDAATPLGAGEVFAEPA